MYIEMGGALKNSDKKFKRYIFVKADDFNTINKVRQQFNNTDVYCTLYSYEDFMLKIYTIINKLVAQGKAVIVISSELPEVLGISDRIYVMNEGKIVGEMDAAEATQEKIMSEIVVTK